MKIKEGFVLRDVCGDQVIIGEGLEAIDFGSLLSLNETATWLWKEAEKQGIFTNESLADALYEEYEVSKEKAQNDVSRLLNIWIKEGMIDTSK